MKEVFISNSEQKILVDDEDFERISKFNWILLLRNGKPNRICRHLSHYGTRYKSISAEVMNDDISLIDHKDRNMFNNQKHNLRFASFSSNSCNRGKALGGCSSKHKGVSLREDTKKWRAEIAVNNKKIYIGQFNTEEEAALAYNKECERLHGKFAVLNQICSEQNQDLNIVV